MTFHRTLSRIAAAAGASLLALAAPAALAAYPDHAIKLIVPFAPGGSNDNIARVLATRLGAKLGQPVVIENKGGAGGVIGTDFVAKSAPDGYTLMLASTSITTNAAAGKKLPYDLLRDLEPIGEIGTGAFAIVVSNEFPAKTLPEFLAAARAKPGSISYGTAGIGGINHLGTELFARAAKIELVHVPYKGIGPAFTDLMGGNLQMLLPSIASVTTHIAAGKMRGLAVTSAARSPLIPDLPTAGEAGVPGFVLEVWWGIVAPSKMPPAIVKQLNEALNAVLALPDVRETLAREGAVPAPSTPEAYGTLIRNDLARWTTLIREAKIQTE